MLCPHRRRHPLDPYTTASAKSIASKRAPRTVCTGKTAAWGWETCSTSSADAPSILPALTTCREIPAVAP
eukprot:1819691-Rhodomonas_salina.2